MIAEKNRVEIKSVLEFLLDYSTTLMGVGVHTSRVVKNSLRIAQSYGYKLNMVLFQKNVNITLSNIDNPLEFVSAVKKIAPAPINFLFISDLSALSWEVVEDNLSLDTARERFQKIIRQPRIPQVLLILLVSLANSAFCILFGGDAIAIGLVFAATAAGFTTRQILFKRKWNLYFIFYTSALVASFIAGLALFFQWGTTPQEAIATSILFLVPGVPLINSVIDLLEGHVLAGVSRFINASLLMLSVTLGLLTTIILLGINSL